MAFDLWQGASGEDLDPIRSSLDHCVKCSICETACPVANVTPLFPGPKYVGPQAERFRAGDVSADDSLDYCSGCGICTQVCPQDVKVAEINSQARQKMKQQRGIPLRDRIIAHPSVMGRIGTPVAPIANRLLRNGAIRAIVERTLRIHRRGPMPLFAGRTFRSWIRRHPSIPAERAVVFFHGCSTNYFEPRLGEMTVAVLEHNGIRAIVPTQGCCGLPLQSNGLFDDARGHVRRLVGHFLPYARRGYPIVATSTSCGLMLKREASEILGVDDEGLRVVSEHLYDVCEFLLSLHERGELRTDFKPLRLTVPYHQPCQGRGHGIGKPAMDLLGLVPELRVVEMDADCCGIAGTYGLKLEKYDIAMKVGEKLFAQVQQSEPDVAACDSEACRWQITHATGVASVHPIELLYRAYGLDAEAVHGDLGPGSVTVSSSP